MSRDLNRGGSLREAQSRVNGCNPADCNRCCLLEIAETAGRNVQLVIARRQAGDGVSALTVADGVAGRTSIEILNGDMCIGNDGASFIADRAGNRSGLYLRDAGGTEEQKSDEGPEWALRAERARVTAQKA